MEPRLSPRFSSGTVSSCLSATGLVAVLVPGVALRGVSSTVEFRGLPELARLLSNAPNMLLLAVGLVEGDPNGEEPFPSEISPVLCVRVRSANSRPRGTSSGLELLSVPRVRPIPALEEDMRR
jgi:hypothetical protein